MTKLRFAFGLTLLLFLLIGNDAASATEITGTDGEQTRDNNLTVLPSPVITGKQVFINWDMELDQAISNPKFRMYIPSDWVASEGDWESASTVTATGMLLDWGDSATKCPSITIGGVTLYCNEWVGDNSSGEAVESIELTFTIPTSAVIGNNRPIRIYNNAGSKTPTLQTVYVTVAHPGTINMPDDDGTPTSIQINRLTATSARNTWLPWGLLAASLALGAVGIYIARRKH